MASREIQKQVKDKLFETWLPDKPGGLKGLIDMAADAALAVVGAMQGLEVAAKAAAEVQKPEIDQTQYLCPQCGTNHKRASGVGTRHAHLFYGGQPELVHLENCPVLEDAEAACNCNAVPASPATRAQARRQAEGSR